jgi:DNA-directed RNA polymerase specialized sigma24 family protein
MDRTKRKRRPYEGRRYLLVGQEQRILYLSEDVGLSQSVIAQRFGVSHESVANALKRAKERRA